MRIATWNINSIRVRLDLMLDVFNKYDIDVLLLQETKSQDKDFPREAIEYNNLNVAFVGQKSYNGVAIISKHPMEVVQKSLPFYNYCNNDDEARYIECLVEYQGKVVRVASVYVPNGNSAEAETKDVTETERFKYKINFYKRLIEYKKQVLTQNEDYVFFAGDYNVAHREIDLHAPKYAFGDVGFHPVEIAKLDEIIDLGYQDTFRHFYKDEIAYTWWDYRHGRWQKDQGWRIDYIFCPQKTIEFINNVNIIKEVRGYEKTSDHTLVVVDFRL